MMKKIKINMMMNTMMMKM